MQRSIQASLITLFALVGCATNSQSTNPHANSEHGGAAIPASAPLTPAHKVLHRFVGTWDARMDMNGEIIEGEYVIELGPGGYSLLGHYTSEFDGMPFEGRSVEAYDSSSKCYVSTWVDSMSPDSMHLTGTWDESTQTLTMTGDAIDPASGQPQRQTHITRLLGPDKMDFQILAPAADGTQQPMFTITYKRKH